jgi:heme/copper-type cytochrome/quinol oxidase subunit 3
VLAFAFPYQVREQGAANAAAAEYAASDKKAQHPALVVLAFAAFILARAHAFVVFLLATLAQEVGQEHAADAAATQHPAPDQKAQDPSMILVVRLILIAALMLVFVLVSLLPVLAQEMREKQAADAGSAQQPARNQKLQDAMLLIAFILAFSARFVAFLLATALTQ